MTRKDYIELAGVVRAARGRAVEATDAACRMSINMAIADIAKDLCEVLTKDNERFDRERFLEACGVQL